MRLVILGAAGIVALALAVVTIIDVVRNRKTTPIPSRPAASLRGGVDQLLRDAANDKPLDLALIQDTCTYINGRYDCADFRFVSLIRLLYQYPDSITAEAHRPIKSAFQNFRYWIEDPGADSMCFWSENHQILFASAEHLAGQLWPDDVFAGSGLTGKEHAVRGRERILAWLEQRWLYGFTEWYSNTYYIEDIGPLSNLIDFSADPEIQQKSRIITDLLLFDMASQSFKGTFITNSGRLYEKGKMSGEHSSTRGISEYIWGYDVDPDDRIGMEYGFYQMQGYGVPAVIKKIGRDNGTAIIKTSNGLNLAELKAKNLIGLTPPQIFMQWGMEAFSNPEVINNSIDIINRYKLHGNEFVYGFKDINYRVLRYSGLLPIFSRLIKPQTNGVAIQRSNSYMYRTPDFSLSTSQAYHPGSYGDQHHIWQATLANDLSIFTTHPAAGPGQKAVLGNSPNYWVGSGHLPHSVQDKNINITLYKLPKTKGLMEKYLLEYTHAYFPRDKFNEVIVAGTYVFGRYDDVYVAMIGNSELAYRDGDPGNDLIQTGRETFWITEISTAQSEGDFLSFQKRIRQNTLEYSRGILKYESGNTAFELEFGSAFLVDGNPVNTNYSRYNTPYIVAEREPDTMVFSFGGSSLELDFYNLVRTVRD